jgi:endonuclease/exonuclease/phosphatase family metal-dependent hydrolase
MAVRRSPRKGRVRRDSAAPERRMRSLPHLQLVRAPRRLLVDGPMGRRISVATYNVHRWSGLNGRGVPDGSRAGFVISELGADVIALQEVLRPFQGEDPLEAIADGLGLHVAFASTRVHRRGELGNAILSRWPMAGVSVLDLSFSRVERRLAMWAQFHFEGGVLDLVATHLALGDRTRHRQVRSLLDHNAWRQCKATRILDDELHHNHDWPPSFPSQRPVLSLDRIYSRSAKILEIDSHASPAARAASDHLPVLAHVELPEA